MTPRLSGHFSLLVWFSLFSSLFWELRDNGVLEKFAILTLKPRSHARFLLFATCTSPIMHLICPPKFCITFVFHFSGVLQPSQEKLKNNAYAKFLGANKVHYGKCGNALYRTRAFTGHISIPILISFLKWPIMVWGPTAQGSVWGVVLLFSHALESNTTTSRHVNMPPPGYPHSSSLPTEAGHVVSPPNSEVQVAPGTVISMSSAANGINGFSTSLPPSITLHNMAVPSSPGFLNGAACKSYKA